MDQRKLCPLCGAPLDDTGCEFDRQEGDAPWITDLESMCAGALSHSEHRIRVARWILHHPSAENTLEAWARKILRLTDCPAPL